jgi:hypothetical protein
MDTKNHIPYIPSFKDIYGYLSQWEKEHGILVRRSKHTNHSSKKTPLFNWGKYIKYNLINPHTGDHLMKVYVQRRGTKYPKDYAKMIISLPKSLTGSECMNYCILNYDGYTAIFGDRRLIPEGVNKKARMIDQFVPQLTKEERKLCYQGKYIHPDIKKILNIMAFYGVEGNFGRFPIHYQPNEDIIDEIRKNIEEQEVFFFDPDYSDIVPSFYKPKPPENLDELG